MGRKKKEETVNEEVLKSATTEEKEEVEAKLEHFADYLNDPQFIPLDDTQIVELIKAERMGKKLKSEIREISNPSRDEIRMLINLFYQMQANRIALSNQIRSIKQENPDGGKESQIDVLDNFMKNMAIMELNAQDTLEIICQSTEVGRWLRQIKGIGPVLAAGCLAYLDVTGKEYASQFISYAGLNDNNRPFIGRVGAERIAKEVFTGDSITDEDVARFANATKWDIKYLTEKAFDQEKQKWSKAELIKAAAKIPYNKELKVLCWKIGQSFNWQCNNTESVYGTLFSQRRALEIERNERGDYAEQAAEILRTKNISKSTTAYKEYSQGRLPKAHINARAQRWAVKIFLSHLFECAYRIKYNKVPPRYYALAKDPLHNKEIAPEVPYPIVDSERKIEI